MSCGEIIDFSRVVEGVKAYDRHCKALPPELDRSMVGNGEKPQCGSIRSDQQLSNATNASIKIFAISRFFISSRLF
jgi:hypothetical protein